MSQRSQSSGARSQRLALAGALSTIAIAPRGSLWAPGPAFHMYKLVLPPAAPRSARIADQPEEIVTNVASALGKPVAQMRIVVLDKPRHAQLELEDLVGADGAFIATGVTGTPTKE